MIDFLTHGSKPGTLYSNMLTFSDIIKPFKPDGDLLKTMTNYKFNVDHSNPLYRKKIREIAEEMNFDVIKTGRPSAKDRSVIRLHNSPAIMAFGVLTIILSSDPKELCDKLKFLLRKKQAGNNSNTIDEEIVDINDKLLEDKSITKKQHRQTLIECNLLHEQV